MQGPLTACGHSHTHTLTWCTQSLRNTLNVQRKDHLQLNYRQIEPWERRSSKTELELNAEAVSPSFTNTLVPFRQTSVSHTQGIPPRQNISYIYLTFCLSHTQTPQTELPPLLKNSGKQEHRWIGICTMFPVYFWVCACLRWCLWTWKSFITGAYLCVHLWMRVRCKWVSVFIPITDCGIPPPHWHLCTCPLPLLRERAKQKQQRKVRGCLLSQKDTTLSRRQSCGKPKKTTTIRAMWREGRGEVKRASVMGEQAGGHMETQEECLRRKI